MNFSLKKLNFIQLDFNNEFQKIHGTETKFYKIKFKKI